MKRTNCILFGICLTLAFLLGCQSVANAADDIAARLAAEAPDDFPHFEFAGNTEQANLLSHYLWYHFHTRSGNSMVLFNKEYMLTSDIWLANARPRNSRETIQDIHRNSLLAIYIDDEGYVSSHQHFSQAHDLGWPFPSWGQAHRELPKVKGKTFGWHFQPLKNVPGWIGGHLRASNGAEYTGDQAVAKWQLTDANSLGIKDNCWQIQTTGPSPTLTTPAGYPIEAHDAPYLQLRWGRSPAPADGESGCVEWLRPGDTDYSPDRRVYFYPEKTPLSKDHYHSIMPMHRHPQWTGKIQRIRISLPARAAATFQIDSFFTVYDTRHTINNPIMILASCRYFNWTGDLDFLRRQIDRMRLALRYQQTEMGGLQFNHIRNQWPGHDGLRSWAKDEKGRLTFYSGHGIGSNYWDILPFGYDDLYATNQYYAATLTMADLEQAISDNPAWQIPAGTLALDPQQLRRHAEKVKTTANRLFFDNRTGRFVACIDKHGNPHDYGYTFLNLDSIWYGLADPDHAKTIMDWIDGNRIVKGDTSTGADIYRWRFAPRATTKRNIEWYGQGWWAPESLDWGYQIQDGGAVLGFSFYDLWARLKTFGPDNAWRRLAEILTWEKEVHAEGGYRKYYADGKRGTTLQGGGTCGGLGIDHEFRESSLLPAIIPCGFMRLRARPDGALSISPNLPARCPRMTITNLLYHNTPITITTTNQTIELNLQQPPATPITIVLEPATPNQKPQTHHITTPGKHTYPTHQ